MSWRASTQMNKNYLFVALIAAFIAYTCLTFSDAVTPYVDIRTAQASQNTVQVKGLLDKAAPSPVQSGEYFVFYLEDEQGGKMKVLYRGAKPDQFDDAYHIVAVGKYRDEAFHAEKLLIKCPSKYESKKGKN